MARRSWRERYFIDTTFIPIAVLLLVKVDVDAGIAKHVGDIIRLPVPVFVKKDGTLLVSAPRGNRADPHDACTSYPNPCSVFPAKSRCSHFDDDLVECSGKYGLGKTLSKLFSFRGWVIPARMVPQRYGVTYF